MRTLLCDEQDIRQRVSGLVHATVLSGLDDEDVFLVGAEDSSDGAGLITRWSAQFEDDVGYAISPRTETITADGSGTNELILPKRYTPIQRVDAVSYVDSGGSVTSYDLGGEAGVLYLKNEPEANVISGAYFGRGRLDLPRWPDGRRNISITLSYGQRNVPGAVRKAVADRVAADVLLFDRGFRDKGLTTKSLGDRSESYGDGRWSDEITAYVAQYNAQVRNMTSEVAL